jgi:hypothetical protein
MIIKALILVLFSPLLKANNLDYRLENGVFYTSEGEIPAECFAPLMTEINGDNSVAAIFINRAELRGCIDANYPYPGGNEEEQISYTIDQALKDDKFRVTVCQKWTSGSMGGTCSSLLIQFINRPYNRRNGSVREVLSLEKLGEY